MKDNRLPHIIVDTCALRGDLALVGTIETYLLATKAKKLVACFPEVVVQEIQRQFCREIATAQKTVSKAADRLSHLTGQRRLEGLVDMMIEGSAENHERTIRARLNGYGAKVLPLPQIDHFDLLRRDLDRRRPFDEDGRGYRDALIWETVLETAVGSKAPVVLVSEDKGFGAKTGQGLHPDLVEDIDRKGLDRSSIVLVSDLVTGLTSYLGSPVDDPEVLAALDKNKKGLREALQARINQQLVGRTVDRGTSSLYPVLIAAASSVHSLTPLKTFKVDDERWMIIAEAIVRAELEQIRLPAGNPALEEFAQMTARLLPLAQEAVDIKLAFLVDRSGGVLGVDIGGIAGHQGWLLHEAAT